MRFAGPAIALGLSSALLSASGGSERLVAQTPMVAVTVHHADTTTAVDPGRTAALSFVVANRGAVAWRARAQVRLPPGWRLVTALDTVAVPGGSADVQLVSIGVPAIAAAGTYTVHYMVHSESGADAIDSVMVIVRERRLVRAEPLVVPPFAAAGESYSVTFLVSNDGNVEERLRLDVRSDVQLAASLDSTALVLRPGESRQVTVSVTTAARTVSVFRHGVHLRVEARAHTSDPRPLVTTASTVVRVVPRAASGASRFRTIPARLTIISTSMGGAPATPGVELTAAGAIGEDARTHVELQMRDAHALATDLGERDEFGFALDNPRFRLRLGDRVYALSPLTEPGLYAFGAGGGITTGRWTIDGYAARDRFAMDGRHEAGASLTLRAFHAAHISFNVLDRSGPDSGMVATLRAQFTPERATTIDVEYGAGVRGSRDGAWAARAHRAGRRISFDLQRVHTDSAYAGFARGLDLDAARVWLRPSRSLRIEGWWLGDSRAEGTFGARSWRWSSRNAGTGITLGQLLTLEYRQQEIDGGLHPSGFVGDQRSVRLRVRPHFGRATLGVESEVGVSRIGVAGERRRFERFAFRPSVRVGRRQTLSGFIERVEGSSLSAGTMGRLSGGVDAGLSVGHTTEMHASLSGFHYDRMPLGDYGILTVGIDQMLPFGHRVSLRARVAAFRAGGRQQSLVQLRYGIPLGLPIGIDRSVGRLAGHIYYLESGEPVARALVSVGDRVVATDERGRLEIGGLRTDSTYDIRLDPSTVGTSRVALHPLPRHVRPLGGRTLPLDVALVRGARVRVQIRAYDFSDAPPGDSAGAGLLRDAGPVRDVALALSRVGEAHRGVTDAAGWATFDELRPGPWIITFVSGELPQHHYLEHDTLLVDVRPGDSLELTIQLLPRRRAVHIVTREDLGAAPSAARPVHHHYTVTRWDTDLMTIARYVYGDSALWPALWVANRCRLERPTALPVGMRLLVPDPGPLSDEEIRAREALAHSGVDPVRAACPSALEERARKVPRTARMSTRALNIPPA
jgi:hypothetical protein